MGLFPAAAFATPPSNDNFANAEALTERFGWLEADNSEATKEPGEPNHAGNPGGASIWYAWTAPNSGLATVSLCWSEIDTLLAVYTVTNSPSSKWSRQTTTVAAIRAE